MKSGEPADVAVIVSEVQCTGAGVFTENRVRAAPVPYDQALLRERPGRFRGVAMNAQFGVLMLANGASDISIARDPERWVRRRLARTRPRGGYGQCRR